MITFRHLLIFIVASYAVVLSPFISTDSRNYLVLFAAMLGGLTILILRLNITWRVFTGILFIFSMALQALLIGGSKDLWSVGLTLVYASGYFAIVCLFERVSDQRAFLQTMTRVVIIAFAGLSVIQMITSFTSLPIPNLITSKGLWSYNSFAFEPSQLGRVVGMTMLAYLMLMSEPFRIERIFYVRKAHLKVLAAFLVTILLSGSALAASVIVAVFIMSRSLSWSIVLTGLAVFFWPMALLIDFDPLNRAALLLSSMGSLDINAMAAADASGASRVIPSVIYLKEYVPSEVGFWIGYSSEGLTRFFLGRLPGLGDSVSTGFLPGFAVIYGVIGLGMFSWIFVFRYSSRTTLPLIGFLLIYFSSSAWNTQVFWYGLILLQMTWAAGRQGEAVVSIAES